jgi:hypothetical protein
MSMSLESLNSDWAQCFALLLCTGEQDGPVLRVSLHPTRDVRVMDARAVQPAERSSAHRENEESNLQA